MRTTITLDPDVEALVKQAMKETDRGLKAVVNDALRRSLALEDADDDYHLPPPVHGGHLLIDLTHTGAVLAELDATEYRDKFDPGRPV